MILFGWCLFVFAVAFTFGVVTGIEIARANRRGAK